jgi:tetratricopeptide (TPR) repeat protein
MASADRPADPPTEDTWQRVDRFVGRFEEAWQAGGRPAIPDYLPATGPDRLAVLIELVHVDLERRLGVGEPARVEQYLTRFPELGKDRAVVCDLIVAEYQLRRRHDPGLTPGEYQQRFPHDAGALAARLGATPLDPGLVTQLPSGDQAAATSVVGPTPSVPAQAGPPLVGPDRAAPPGYEILQELARGGMGVVSKARHLPLQRSVALKVLRDDYRGLSEMEGRFLEEAQLTGQLQHPGIPPVHEVGVLPDGRPFMAMKLIQGRTLADLLQERSTPAADLPRFLAIFEQVCQTLAYAHSRGVIHRDLKPSNVMVGAFGEVQVMDWGLAKVLSGTATTVRTERPGEASTLATVRTATPGLSSQAGTVLGTPAYMAPEQARGEIDSLNERCDVFGLGAILCVVLTGHPPYRGGSTDEIHAQATRGDVTDAFARLEASGADAELIQLGKACLSPERDCRPRDAGEVAQAAAVYQAGVRARLHAAEIERAAAQARAEEAAKKVAAERRARRKVQALSAVVLLVLLAGIAGTTWGLVRETRQREIAEGKEQEAKEQTSRAEQAEAATLASYRASTDDAIEQLIGSKPVLGAQEKAYLEKTLKRWQAFAARKGEDERSRAIRAEGEFRVAYLRAKLGQTAEAIAGYRAALAKQQKLAEDFPAVPEYRRNLARAHNNLGAVQADRNQVEQATEQFRKALAVRQKLADEFPTEPEYYLDLAGSHNNLGLLLTAQNQREQAAEHYRKALAILQKLVRDFHAVPAYRQSLSRSYISLATLLQAQNQWGEAVKHHRRALAHQQKLAGAFPAVPAYRQELARSHNGLGILLKAQNQREQAAEHHRKALAILQRLADEFPAMPEYRHDLGSSHSYLGLLLTAQNQREQAAEHYRKALAILQKLTDAFPTVPAYRQALASSHSNMGSLLAVQNQGEQAAEQLRKALTIRQKLHNEFPAMPEYRQEMGQSHYNLGNLLANQKQGEKAAEQYCKALAIQQKLADEFAAVPAYRRDLALSHNNLGLLLVALNQAEPAAEQYCKALAIQQKLADDFPARPDYRGDLAGTHNNFGNLLMAQNKVEKAAEQYGKAIAIKQKLADEFPEVPEYQVDLGGSCCNYAVLLKANGKPADSLPWYDKAIRRLTRGLQQDPQVVIPEGYLGNIYGGRAGAYDQLEKYDEAVKDWTRAIELSPRKKQPFIRSFRANSLFHSGRVAAAVAEVVELTKERTWPADHWYNFACIYAVASGKAAGKKQEYADRAMELLRLAVKAGYNNAAHMQTDKDLDVLRQRDDFKKLLESLARPNEKAPARQQ